jgi:N-acetylglucosamine-6-phosphate deacetylase
MASSSRLTKFTNCLLLSDKDLVGGGLLVNSQNSKILPPQPALHKSQLTPDQTIDLNGKVITPGFIDV